MFHLIGNHQKVVSLNLPTIEIRFENLTVEGEGYVGSRALPSVFNYFLNITEVSDIKREEI